MKAALIRNPGVYYYNENGEKILGVHSELRGDVGELRGDVSGLWGDVSGLRGDVGGLWGDVDECELTSEDRRRGVNIDALVESEK